MIFLTTMFLFFIFSSIKTTPNNINFKTFRKLREGSYNNCIMGNLIQKRGAYSKMDNGTDRLQNIIDCLQNSVYIHKSVLTNLYRGPFYWNLLPIQVDPGSIEIQQSPTEWTHSCRNMLGIESTKLNLSQKHVMPAIMLVLFTLYLYVQIKPFYWLQTNPLPQMLLDVIAGQHRTIFYVFIQCAHPFYAISMHPIFNYIFVSSPKALVDL